MTVNNNIHGEGLYLRWDTTPVTDVMFLGEMVLYVNDYNENC